MMTEIGTTRSGITEAIARELLKRPDDPVPYTLANTVYNIVEKRRETLRK